MMDDTNPTAPTAGTRRGLRSSRTFRAGLLVAAALVVPVLVSCGNLTAGGASEVEVIVASDDSEGSGSPPAGSRTDPAGMPVGSFVEGSLLESQILELEGTLRLRLSVTLIDTDGDEFELTSGTQDVELGLAAGTRQPVGLVSVPAGEYRVVSASFSRVEAHVDAGPISLPDLVEVDLSSGPATVESEQAFTLGAEDRVRIVLDLRTGAWIATPAAERPSAFRNAVRLDIESGG